MARNESDREDLIREATAFPDRIEWNVPELDELVIAGVKADGSLAIYFGADPVYQFSSTGGLRRAFVDGCLYRTQGHTLARLIRDRSSEATVLQRSDLSDEELTQFLACMDDRLSHLKRRLLEGTVTTIRSVSKGRAPDYASLIDAVISASPKLSPAIPTRRR